MNLQDARCNNKDNEIFCLANFHYAVIYGKMLELFVKRVVKYKAIPVQALKVPGGFHISSQSAYGYGKAVRLMHRPPLPPGNNPGTNFC